MKYDITINGAGILTKDLNKNNILILFEDTTSDIFKEFGLLHPKAELKEDIVVGDTFDIDGVKYNVIAVGDDANRNLRETGHVSIHIDDDPELEASGIIIISGPQLTPLKEGSRIIVE